MNKKATNITINFKNPNSNKRTIKNSLSYQACIAGKLLSAQNTSNHILPVHLKSSDSLKSNMVNKKISGLVAIDEKKTTNISNKKLNLDSEIQSYIDYEGEKKYFQAPFENLREHLKDESYLTQISVAIIMQAMIDCTAHGSGKYTKKIRKDAREWIFTNGPNFKQTCIEARILPEFVINKTKELIGITDPTRPSNQNLDITGKQEVFYQYKMKKTYK